MLDEPNLPKEESEPDELGGDPEVPLVPHVHDSHPHKHDRQINGNSTVRKIYQVFQTICVFVRNILSWSKTRKADHWAALAAMIAAIAAIFSTVATGMLTFYARRTWKLADDQVYIAKEANRFTRFSQWPYVDAHQEFEVEKLIEQKAVVAWVPKIKLTNGGNTGTYTARETINVYISKKEVTDTSCNFPKDGRRYESDIGPHLDVTLEAPTISVDAIQSLSKGGHIYIHGNIIYRDAFEFFSPGHMTGPQKHLREFCYELRLDSSGDVRSPEFPTPKSLVVFGTRNCTDGGCADYNQVTENK